MAFGRNTCKIPNEEAPEVQLAEQVPRKLLHQSLLLPNSYVHFISQFGKTLVKTASRQSVDSVVPNIVSTTSWNQAKHGFVVP